MTQSKSKYSGVKLSVQLTSELADKVEMARRLTGFTRQELIENALAEFISNNREKWRADFERLVGEQAK